MINQGNWASDKRIAAWMANCRLDPYSGQARRLRAEDVGKIAALTKLRDQTGPARRNLSELCRTIGAGIGASPTNNV